MKRLLLILFFLCSQVYSQNEDYFTTIRNLDEQGAEKIAIEIASMTRNQFKIVSKSESQTELSFIMGKISMTKDDVINALSGNYEDKDAIFEVIFERFMEGENKALEIKGNKKYSFYGVSYNYLDLFPFWQKYFSPNATTETTLKDYNLQKSEIRDKQKWWLYKFQVSDGNNRRVWTLRKFY